MDHPNLTTYTKREPFLDGFSLFGATALSCTARGISLTAPTGVGTLALTGVNVMALSAFNTIESRLLKVCAVITILALTILALPYLITSFAAHSFVVLSLDTAIEIGLLHLATKVATYGVFKSGLFFNDYFFLNFPQDVQAVAALPTDKLPKVKQHLLDFPSSWPLPFQFALNHRLEDKKLGALPYSAFSDLGNWSKEDLEKLHKEDLSQIPLPQRAQINELFFSESLPPQNRPYVADELPDVDNAKLKKKYNRPLILWYHLIAQHKPEILLSPQISNQFYSYKLPPARDESIPLPMAQNPRGIDALAEYQIPWYYNLLKKDSATWNSLSYSIQLALNKRFTKPLPLTATPGAPASLQESSINWKQVTLAATIGTVFIGGLAYYLYSTGVSSPPPPPHDSPASSNPLPSLINAFAVGWLACIGYSIIKPESEKKQLAQKIEPINPLPLPQEIVPSDHSVGIEYEKNNNLIRLVLSLEDPNIQKALREAFGNKDLSGISGKIFHLADPNLIAKVERLRKREELLDRWKNCNNPREQVELIKKIVAFNDPTLVAEIKVLSPQKQPALLEASKQGPILIDEKEQDWEGLRAYVNECCPGVEFEDAQTWASKGLDIIEDLRLEKKVDQTNLEEKLIWVCWGFITHVITKGQGFHEGTIVYHDPGLRLFNFFAPLYYGRFATHFEERAICAFSEGRLKGWSHFGYDPNHPLPANKGAVLIGAIKGAKECIYLKMEDWGSNLNFISDPRAFWKSFHIIFHTWGLINSKAKRWLPFIFGDVGEGARKEHIPPKIREKLLSLFEKCHIKINRTEFNEYGISYAIPLLSKASENSDLNPEAFQEIESLLAKLDQEYDHLDLRKGNEGIIADSIIGYKKISHSETGELTSLLAAKPLMVPFKMGDELLEENASVFVDQNSGVLDRERIFKQVRLDLERVHRGMSSFKIDGSLYKNVESIFDTLCQYTDRDEQKALKILSTLQQGVFTNIEMQIYKDLALSGEKDAKFLVKEHSQTLEEWLRNQKLPLREYRLDMKNGVIECDAYYELLPSDLSNNNSNPDYPRAILKATVQIDLNNGPSNELWDVEHINE